MTASEEMSVDAAVLSALDGNEVGLMLPLLPIGSLDAANQAVTDLTGPLACRWFALNVPSTFHGPFNRLR